MNIKVAKIVFNKAYRLVN